MTPTGELLVRRFTARGEAETYDVFSREGVRIRQVILPADRFLLGFGAGSMYLYHTDEDDLQWLERYELQRQLTTRPTSGSGNITREDHT
jgi:hypothetical protein